MYQWSINVGPQTRAVSTAKSHMRGFLAGTLVAREQGWVPIEHLRKGDSVWTFDSGLQVIREIRTGEMPRHGRPGSTPDVIHIPAGALANTQDINVLPEQGLLLECENASDAYGDPFAVIPAAALEGVVGIERDTAQEGVRIYEVVFAEDQALYIDSGLLAFCPAYPDETTSEGYDIRSMAQAKKLLTDLDLAELALREPDEEFFGEIAPDRVA